MSFVRWWRTGKPPPGHLHFDILWELKNRALLQLTFCLVYRALDINITSDRTGWGSGQDRMHIINKLQLNYTEEELLTKYITKEGTGRTVERRITTQSHCFWPAHCESSAALRSTIRPLPANSVPSLTMWLPAAVAAAAADLTWDNNAYNLIVSLNTLRICLTKLDNWMVTIENVTVFITHSSKIQSSFK